MTFKEAIVLRFTQICQKRNITTNELANLSGITPSTVYTMMGDKSKDVSAVTVKKLCDGLNISIIEFYDSDIFKSLEQEIK